MAETRGKRRRVSRSQEGAPPKRPTPASTAEARPRPLRPRLLPSSDGRLTEVLLCITGAAQTEPEVVGFFKRLIHKMIENGVKVTILTQDRDEDGEPLKVTWPGVKPIVVPWQICFTMWGRDPFVVLKDGQDNRTWLAEPVAFKRMGDALVADWYANRTKTSSTQTALFFEGGNILCGDDFVLIGANSVNDSLELVGKSIYPPRPDKRQTPIDRVRSMYAQSLDMSRRWYQIGTHLPIPAEERSEVERGGETWTEIRYVFSQPGNCQPLFHLDMFLTLAGRATPESAYRILVGDPRWAAKLMGEEPPPDALADHFDDVAANLRGMGFDVIRNPLAYLRVDDPRAKTLTWYYASSNNMLVERFDHETKDRGTSAGRAWIPTYGSIAGLEKMKAVDAKNKEIWEKELNFEIEEITGCLPFVQKNGSIHCLVKELERSPNSNPDGESGWQGFKQDPKAPTG
jgi:hypothetical protein